jgi:UDP-glucose 4-epimerase
VLDNLHRDSLTGTDLAEHENLRFVQGDVLDLPLLRELTARATHVVHLAAIAGVDSVLKSPVRTMRVNLIGTSNVLEAALEAGTIERLIDFSDQRGLRHARLQGRGDARHLAGLGRRGALDVRSLEARG